jgi:hypothetical protein
MPVRIILFYAVQAAACWYALRRGGAPERWTALFMMLAALASSALPAHPGERFRGVEWGQLGVDAVLTLVLFGLALRANRFWLLWAAALQILALAVHGVRAYDADILPIVYNRSIGKVAYPLILLLLVGTYRYQARAASGRRERDWSPLRW